MNNAKLKFNPAATRLGQGIYSVADLRDRCRINSETGCWLWSMSKVRTGSGSIVPKVSIPVGVVGNERPMFTTGPKAGWLLSGRTLREGFIVWRECREGLCVNPAHLKAGTHVDEGKWNRDAGYLKGSVKRTAINRQNSFSLVTPAETVEKVVGMLADGVSRVEIEAATGLTRTTIYRIRDGMHYHQRGASLARGASVFSMGAAA